MSSRLEVVAPGPTATVQDLGRPGHAALGVPESGALDPAALRLANRLVGNPEGLPGLEVTLGGLRLRARGRVEVALTGAPVAVTVDGVAAGVGQPVDVPHGAELSLGTPTWGVRSYLAIRGGLVVTAHLGSASTDLLSGLGAPLSAEDQLEVGHGEQGPVAGVDAAPLTAPTENEVQLRVVLGPRGDWFTEAAVRQLTGSAWIAEAASNRVGLRLSGPTLTRALETELPSEGAVAGAPPGPARWPRAVLSRPPRHRRLPGDRGGRDRRPSADRAGSTRSGAPVPGRGAPVLVVMFTTVTLPSPSHQGSLGPVICSHQRRCEC